MPASVKERQKYVNSMCTVCAYLLIGLISILHQGLSYSRQVEKNVPEQVLPLQGTFCYTVLWLFGEKDKPRGGGPH